MVPRRTTQPRGIVSSDKQRKGTPETGARAAGVRAGAAVVKVEVPAFTDFLKADWRKISGRPTPLERAHRSSGSIEEIRRHRPVVVVGGEGGGGGGHVVPNPDD